MATAAAAKSRSREKPPVAGGRSTIPGQRPSTGRAPQTLLAGQYLTLGLIISSLLLMSACGYRVVGSEPTNPYQPRVTLAILPFENRSMEPGLETIFANDMIQAFQQSGTVQVRPGDTRADYQLHGIIKKLEHSSTAYLDIDRSLIRRVTLTVEINVKNMNSGKVIWQSTETVRHDYVADKYYGIGEATRDQGLRQMSVRLAQRVQDKVSLLF